jgi:hypothetical protein
MKEIMKSIFKIFGLLLIGLSTSCTSSKNSSAKGYEPDDRYFSLADAKRERRQYQKLNNQPDNSFRNNQDASNNNNINGYENNEPSTQNPNSNPDYNYTPAPQTNNGGTTVNNYYNDLDDNYDFQYASRFRRFHNNWGNMGYYDPFMTNMYWYNYDPFMFGNSIYSTCNFFNPYNPWGWNNFGGGPGLNFGWNSWSGFYMNYGMGFNNPWAWNNPWRWNNWGFSPFNSPFSYNPWGFNPYGFGMNQFSMGYNTGFYNGFMMNQMMNNQMYFNSFDNNSLQPIINTPVGVNVGGGSVFKVAQPTLAEQFTKEIPNQSNMVTGTKNQLNAVSPGKTSPVNQSNINTGAVKPSAGNNLNNPQPNIPVPQNSLTGKDGQPNQAIQNTTNQGKPVITNSQQNKNDLINSGATPTRTEPVKSPASNYTSAPSIRPSQEINSIRGNNLTSPGENRPTENNISTRPERPQSIRNQDQLNNVTPQNRINNDVRGNTVPSQQPAVIQPRNNYQQYQSPQNFNRYNNSNRNEQTPQQRPNYQQPNRNNQNNSNQQYQEPQQRNNYSEPRQKRNDYSQPRQQYQAPRQQPRESNRGGSNFNTPRQSNPTPQNRSFDSSPRNNSGGGSSRSAPSSGGGGSRMNSPRR